MNDRNINNSNNNSYMRFVLHLSSITRQLKWIFDSLDNKKKKFFKVFSCGLTAHKSTINVMNFKENNKNYNNNYKYSEIVEKWDKTLQNYNYNKSFEEKTLFFA